MSHSLRTWHLNRPMYNFRSRDAGNLTVDYSDGADHRWPKWVTLGPKLNPVALSTAGATLANTNKFALIPQASDTSIYWLYTAHGDKLDKRLWSDMVAATNQPAAVAERVTDLLVTRTPAGTRELSAFMLATAYRVYPTITATGATDTVSANNQSQILRIAGIAPDRIAGFSGQKAYGNVLSSTITMDASSWQELAAFLDSDIVPTGFETTNGLWIWGTNIGPLMLNSQTQQFFALLGQLPADLDNCRGTKFIEFMGVLIPLSTMLRAQSGAFSERVGPERFGNPNPIQGKVSAITSNADWAFTAHRNASESVTYFAASKPGSDGLPDFYGIGKQTEVAEAMHVPPQATRDRQTLLIGADDDMNYVTIGNVPTWPDDTSYRYADDADQTIYGTEWYPPNPVRVEEIGFTLDSASAGQTVAPGIKGMTASGQVFSQTFAPFNRAGLHRFPIPPALQGSPVVRYQPYFVLRSSASTATPKLTPEIRVWEEDDVAHRG